MKKIVAVIRTFKEEDVVAELLQLEVTGITITEVKGFGRQKGLGEIYRESEYRLDFLPRIMLERVVPDQQVETIVKAIIAKSKTGKIGDGKIFVTKVLDAIRIRTGERGESAI